MAFETHCRFRNTVSANKMAANYRKQFSLGLDGKPRRYGKRKKDLAPGDGCSRRKRGSQKPRDGRALAGTPVAKQ